MSGGEHGFGTTLIDTNRTRFSLWAPNAQRVYVHIEALGDVPMEKLADGWYAAEIACGCDTLYQFRVDDLLVPDPASRAQAGDVHGPSIVIDPDAYRWAHPNWKGRLWHETVIYEIHVGSLGSFAGVTERLAYFAELGVTAIELMPIGDFPGTRNWGYDGVLPYAPDAAYGTPDALKKLIDTAHGLGLMVFLDVVYNHFGPDGNYLPAYAPSLYRQDRETPWGNAIDFRHHAVRKFFVENAIYWLNEFRFDGLRFDAVHEIQSSEFLLSMANEIRSSVDPHRHVHLVLENEHNESQLLREGSQAPGFDAQWADDLHHCVHVLLTGECEGYYADFAEAPARLLARCLSEGFAFQGEAALAAGGAGRGTASSHLPSTAFVFCLQNHDQIGNRAFGERLNMLAHPDGVRAATVMLLLCPSIPLLFMGQEFASKAPFLFFADHHDDLAENVREGRRQEFSHFAAFSDPQTRARIPDPNAAQTFADSRPNFSDLDDPHHGAWYTLHQQLLALRARHLTPRLPGTTSVSAQALGQAGVHAQWRLGDGAVLTMAVNLSSTALPCPVLPGLSIFETSPIENVDEVAGYAAHVTLQEAAA